MIMFRHTVAGLLYIVAVALIFAALLSEHFHPGVAYASGAIVFALVGHIIDPNLIVSE